MNRIEIHQRNTEQLRRMAQQMQMLRAQIQDKIETIFAEKGLDGDWGISEDFSAFVKKETPIPNAPPNVVEFPSKEQKGDSSDDPRAN